MRCRAREQPPCRRDPSGNRKHDCVPRGHVDDSLQLVFVLTVFPQAWQQAHRDVAHG